MENIGGEVYGITYCPVCKREEEQARQREERLIEQTEVLAAEQAHQNYLLEKQHQEDRKHREEQKEHARKERDASYLRTGILEFDEAYQREWEECTSKAKQLKSEVSLLEAKLKDEHTVLSAFRTAYDFRKDHKYRRDISDTLDIRFNYKDWSHKLEEICRKQNEIVQQISEHKSSVEGELIKLHCPDNILSATESIDRVIGYHASNNYRKKNLKYNIDFKPSKGWLLTSLTFFTLNIACNAMCAENAYDFRITGFAGFLLITSAILCRGRG